MRLYWVICWVCLCYVNVNSQVLFHANADAPYLYSNPAAAGASSKLSLHALHHKSWASDQAPLVTGLSVHLPFRFERYGVGMVFLKEQSATTSVLKVKADFSTKIIFGKGYFSYGGRLGISQVSSEWDAMQLKHPDDPLATYRQILPDAAIGALYRTKKYLLSVDYSFHHGLYRAGWMPYKSMVGLLGYATFTRRSIEFCPGGSVWLSAGIKPLVQVQSSLLWKKFLGIGIGAKSPGIVVPAFLLQLKALTGKDVLLRYSFEKRIAGDLAIPDQGHELQIRMLLRKSATVESIRNMRTTESPLDFQ